MDTEKERERERDNRRKIKRARERVGGRKSGSESVFCRDRSKELISKQ